MVEKEESESFGGGNRVDIYGRKRCCEFAWVVKINMVREVNLRTQDLFFGLDLWTCSLDLFFGLVPRTK